jgi:aspartokinase/homoserine dehydrogenase 1
MLYGVGTIGAELLRQINEQRQQLLQQRIDLRVIAIANSKRLIWQPQGLSLHQWQEQLANSTMTSEVSQLLSLINRECPLNPVLVDCTCSDQLAQEYLNLFQHGIHIVAANKKANTGSYPYYRSLREAAHQSLRQFGYETNVGAGLPIIANIRNQVRSGDKLKSFSGILSGSLSFIMGKLEDGYSFSQAVIEAKEKGFTEPDPRDDLSGMDVARKLLIIAREFGSQAELDDVMIEPLLSHELINAPNIDSFLQQLPSIDKSIAERQQKAQACDKVLRYAGTIEPNGQMAVKLIEVDRQHALYAIRDGENAFSFSTQRYHPVPMVIRGYGAGAEVTAAGVFGDILQTVVA